jgi:hypothetical protein
VHRQEHRDEIRKMRGEKELTGCLGGGRKIRERGEANVGEDL